MNIVSENQFSGKTYFYTIASREIPVDTDAALGDRNVTLGCAPPRGHPEPTVRWKKDGEVIDLTSDKR